MDTLSKKLTDNLQNPPSFEKEIKELKNISKIKINPILKQCVLHGRISQIELPVFVKSDDTTTQTNQISAIKDFFQKIPFDDFIDGIIWIGKIFYVICPPIPSKIISKAAFHPPKRGKYYFLIVGTKNEKKITFYAEQAIKMKNVSICFRTFVQCESIEVNVAGGFCRINTCILKTRLNDYIVMIHIKSHPSAISGHKSPKIMIISQPNSSDIGACMISDPSLVEIADSLCCDVIAYDYSGYGCSSGSPSESAIYVDIETVYKYVHDDLEYNDEDICLFGFSMGTAASIHLASIIPKFSGMILVAPFTSLLRIIGKTDSPSTCCWDQFSSYDKASSIHTRTLICHGEKDSMVGIAHSEVLSQKLQNVSDVFFVPKATHRGIYGEAAMWQRIRTFVNDELGFCRSWQRIVVFTEVANNAE